MAATDKHRIIEELLEAAFVVSFDPRTSCLYGTVLRLQLEE
jgi:hypothetical protein